MVNYMYELDERLLASMRKLGLTDTRLVIACSGGVDSLALVDSLARLRRQLGLELIVAHFEHGIRGAESQSDALFVEKVARARKLAFFVGHADVPREAAARALSIETAARKLRYEFLERIRCARAASYILTAHHADDQAETILMHLLRGSGAAGLTGMRPISLATHIARPLLGMTKQELRDYCLARDLVWREDSTNEEIDCTRNRIRLGLLPTLKRYNPNIVARLNSMGELLLAENDFIERQALAEYERLRGEDARGVYIMLEADIDPVIVRRVVRIYWAEQLDLGAPVNLSQEHTAAIVALMRAGRTGSSLALPQGYTARISYGRLYITRPERREASLDDWHITLEERAEIPERTGPLEFYFTPRDGEQVTIRYRQPGDFIELKSGHKKLKDLFIDDKVPREERDAIPLLAVGHEILWVIGRRRSVSRPAIAIENKQNIIYVKAERNEE